MITLKGNALVTGGSRGIGKEIVKKLANMGLNVYIHYFMDETSAINTKSEVIEKYGVNAEILQANLADPEEVKNMFCQIQNLEVLINNAASGVHKSIKDLRIKDWDWTMNVNARGALLCSQEAIKVMNDNRTTYIINITSMGSQRILPEYGAIGCSKASIETLTKYTAVEYSEKNVVVNCIAGGVVETDALEHFPNKEKILKECNEKTPARRLTKPKDIANIVEFLCSSNADMIRGQTIIVDGGYSLY